MIWAAIWYWLLAVFTAADVVTTERAIALGAHEINPVMAPIVDNLILVKMAFLLVAAAIIIYTEGTWKGSGWKPACAGACVAFVPVVSNLLWFASNL
jgi:hypothetical protein